MVILLKPGMTRNRETLSAEFLTKTDINLEMLNIQGVVNLQSTQKNKLLKTMAVKSKNNL